jgi:hypothetical protein
MRALSILMLAVLLAGCGTYINIPKQPGDVAWHSANDFTVKRVTAAALKYLIQQMPTDPAYGVQLSPGATDLTYKFVMEQLPGTPHRQRVGEIKLPTYSIAGVYVRARGAQVDIIRPTADGAGQLVSVYLEFAIDGWYGKRHRVWNIPVTDAIKAATPGETIR